MIRASAARALASVLLFSLAFGSELVLAANVYITKGEGGAGLDAYFELDNYNQFGLSMRSCKRRGSKVTLSIDLHFKAQHKFSPELEKLWNSEDNAKRDLYLCLNKICEERQWEFAESGFGPVWYADNISIDHKREKISSVRVIIPNDNTNYEYQGDIDGILNKICR